MADPCASPPPAPGRYLSTYRSERSPRSRCQCRYGGDEGAALPHVPPLARVRRRPVAAEQRAEQADGLRRGYDAAGHPALPADAAAGGDGEETVRAGHSAARAVAEARRVAVDGERAQQEGVEDQPGRVLAPGEGAQPADEQEVLLDGGLPLVVGEPLGGLQHGGAGGVPVVVGDDAGAVRGDGLGLGAERQAAPDQLAAPREVLHVDVGEGLKAGAELRLGAPHPARDGADPPVAAGEEGDDPVRLTQLLGAQHDAVVAEQTHGPHCPARPGPGGPGSQEGVRAAVRRSVTSSRGRVRAAPMVVRTSRSAGV
ncbi:hypothetical protein M2168_004534 [Streptomyces sp. CZ24]|nr:hypothetical protein [Streptomyces sp. CZ24]